MINDALYQAKSSNKSSDCACNRKWTYFQEPKPIYQFSYQSLDQVIVSFQNVISKQLNAEYIKLLLFLRTGSESGSDFWTRTKVIDGDQQFVHWTYGCRYAQNAISYNSQTIIVPCKKTRQFRVKTNKIQKTNCHNLQYFITGYSQKQ